MKGDKYYLKKILLRDYFHNNYRSICESFLVFLYKLR